MRFTRSLEQCYRKLPPLAIIHDQEPPPSCAWQLRPVKSSQKALGSRMFCSVMLCQWYLVQQRSTSLLFNWVTSLVFFPFNTLNVNVVEQFYSVSVPFDVLQRSTSWMACFQQWTSHDTRFNICYPSNVQPCIIALMCMRTKFEQLDSNWLRVNVIATNQEWLIETIEMIWRLLAMAYAHFYTHGTLVN